MNFPQQVFSVAQEVFIGKLPAVRIHLPKSLRQVIAQNKQELSKEGCQRRNQGWELKQGLPCVTYVGVQLPHEGGEVVVLEVLWQH